MVRITPYLATAALAAVLALPAAAVSRRAEIGEPAAIAYPANGNIYLIDADGTNRQVLVSGRGAFRVDHWGGIAWSHDGERLAFTVGNHRESDNLGETLRLYTAGGDGAGAQALTDIVGAFDPSWSPDGSQLAFAIRSAGRTSIAVVGADGQGLRRLVSGDSRREFYWVPDWSPDGTWILFEIAPAGDPRTKLMAIHPNGTGLHQLAAIKTLNHCLCADWSPDGTQIAFQAPGAPARGATPRYDYPEIWVMNSDASHRVQLTKNRTRDENPDWSPDGRTIAFYSERAGNAEIYVIDAGGGQARRVTHDPWYDGPPRWRPTG